MTDSGTLQRRLAALLAGLLSSLAAGATANAADALAFSELRPGVFVHTGVLEDGAPANRGDVANLGFIIGRRCVAVVDTGGTPALGVAVRAAVERATALPVCFVINTHMHPDHLLGNSAFAAPPGPPPQFIGHARLGAALAARERNYLNALQRDFGVDAKLVYPTRGVEGQIELDLGGRSLQLRAWPTAHTDNDLTVYDPQTRTLFMSDLLFVGHIPVLDGQLRGWIGVLGEIATLDVALVVPGHGAPQTDWPAALTPELTYLSALRDETRRAIKAGETIQQAVGHVGVAEAKRWQLAEQFHRRNATAAYAELEWED